MHRLDETQTQRPIMRISLGCHLVGAANPVPDTTHAPSIAQGAIKRVAAKMPVINRPKLRRLKRFCKRFLDKNFEKFDSTEHFEFEEWIENAPYERYRKNELKEVHENLETRKPGSGKFNKYKIVKMFVKDENYPEYKFHRLICSRTDEYKVLVGPFFKKLGEKIFKSKWFIKKISMDKRPSAIYEKLRQYKTIFCTDFSKFEATFEPLLLKIEEHIYRWFLEDNPHAKEIMDLIIKGMHGKNVIQNMRLSFEVVGKRMSGEMNTSEANGLMNLMMTFFILEENNIKEYDAYFEGDDGIIGINGNLPTEKDYADLGARIKIDLPNKISEASFCGLIFDEEVGDNVCDPVEALMSFGYTTRQYITANKRKKESLLRVKSLSMLYQYPGCPILASLGRYGLRVTNHINDNQLMATYRKMKLNNYERQELDLIWKEYKGKTEIFHRSIDSRTRVLVSNRYRIPIETQHKIEQYLDNLNVLEPLVIPEFMELVSKDCIHYYETYGANINTKEQIRYSLPDFSHTKYKIWTDADNWRYV